MKVYVLMAWVNDWDTPDKVVGVVSSKILMRMPKEMRNEQGRVLRSVASIQAGWLMG